MLNFFVVFGRYRRPHRIKGETFLCPTCGSHQYFWQKSLRAYFHIFFIPLFRVGDDQVLPQIECAGCGNQFHERVLHKTSALMAEIESRGPAKFDPKEDLTTTAECAVCGRKNSVNTIVCPRCETRLRPENGS
jgi:hypothetical protein